MTNDEASEAVVSYEVSEETARIMLARAPVNALSFEMIRAVITALERAADDRAARVVVLSSVIAKHFSAGLDVNILLEKPGDEIREFLLELYLGLYDAQCTLGKPSIAAVAGAARGGGMTLAVSCDVIVAGKGATFGYPEIGLGLLPAIHFAHLPRVIGRHRAFELLFSGRSFSAQEAFALGLINRTVPDGDLDIEVMKLARDFAAKSETVVRLGRAAFLRQADRDYRRCIADAIDDFCNVALTGAAREGFRAFVDKCPPKW